MSSGDHDDNDPAEAIVQQRRWWRSPIWAIPIVAIIVAGYLAYTVNSDTGQTIRITFLTGNGLKADKTGHTSIKHNGVEVGVVDKVELIDDLKTVRVTATMQKMADPFLNKQTQFWVVRPRISLSNLSGIDTLLGDKYIEMEPGPVDPNETPLGEPNILCRHTGLSCDKAPEFKGQEKPPAVRSPGPGTQFVLDTEQLGSIEPATPVYYNGQIVGEVLDTKFVEGTGKSTINLQVNDPYDKRVRVGSRFYNDSGVTITAGLAGVKIEMESIPALLSGGVAFMAPPEGDSQVGAAPRNSRFPLYANRAEALEAIYAQRLPFILEFDGSVHGLEVGAPVEFRGIKVGRVTDIHLHYDARDKTNPVRIPVTIAFEPQRVERAGLTLGQISNDTNVQNALQALVAGGMRAQLRSQSILSGTLFIAFDIFPDRPGAIRQVDDPAGGGRKMYELPTVSSESTDLDATINGLAEGVTQLIRRVNSLPLVEFVQEARDTFRAVTALAGMPQIKDVLIGFGKTLDTADSSLRRLDALLASADAGYGNGSEVRRNVVEALRQLQDTLKEIKVLADSIERHPESIIRGKGGLP